MYASSALLLTIGLFLAGCVTPEEPAPVVRRAPAANTSIPPRAQLEDAPVPNRRARGPIDQTIRIQN
jgi:PBP1b-binding outer membrane lipoprotein LpoB